MSRRRSRFTLQAKEDLRGIALYISKDSPRAAKAVVEELREVCRTTLVMFPDCGTMRDELIPGMRCFSVGNYVIYFRGKKPIEIPRILHGAQDVGLLDFLL
jgi:toxin ParE1/3/4